MGKKKKETLKNIKPKKKLSSDFYLTFVERAYLSVNILNETLVEHSVYDNHPAIAKKVDQIIEDCVDIYQLAGYLMHVKCTEEEEAENQSVKKM